MFDAGLSDLVPSRGAIHTSFQKASWILFKARVLPNMYSRLHHRQSVNKKASLARNQLGINFNYNTKHRLLKAYQ